MLAAATARPLSGASEQIATGPTLYAGLVVAETSGTDPVSVRVYNGTSAAGVLVDTDRKSVV